MDASGRIWILQSRPITSLPPGLVTLAGGRVHAAWHYVPGSGADPEKVVAREVADRMAARSRPTDRYQICPQRVYMFRNPSGARIRTAELKGLFDENFVELKREVLTLGELAHVLSGGTGRDRVRVKDFPVARVSGLSCVLADGNVLVEYAAGAGLTVARGLAAASGLIVTRAGRVLRRWGCTQDEMLVFDRRHRRIEPRPYGKKPRLDAGAARLVVDMTIEMAARVPAAVIEWWIVGRRIYLVDCAAESASIPGVPTSDITWVSGESMRGRVVWIGDTEPLRQMCQQLGMEGAAALAKRPDAAQTFGLDLPRDESVIIGSDLPAIPLFALAPLAAGFVFRSGSILCHLGTLLREAGVPAAIAPGYADADTHGQWVELRRAALV